MESLLVLPGEMDLKGVAAEVAELKRGDELYLSGLKGSSSFFLVARLFAELKGKAILIVPDGEGEKAFDDLSHFLGGSSELFFLPSMDGDGEREATFRRVGILYRFSAADQAIIVVTPGAVSQGLPPVDLILSSCRSIRKGMELDRDAFLQDLLRRGYRMVEMVGDRGDVAVRGFIVDLFPPLYDNPVRLEFLGDEVESIRTFDPSSQMSTSEIGELVLLSPVEGALSSSIFEYLPGGLIFIKDRTFVAEGARRLGWDGLKEGLKGVRTVYLDLLTPSDPGRKIIAFRTETNEDIRRLITSRKGEYPFQPFTEKVREWLDLGYRVELVVRSHGQADRFRDLLEDYRIPGEGVYISVGRLSEGFRFPSLRTAIVTEEEVLGPKRRFVPVRRMGKVFLRSLSDIEEGDLVVHSFHGIGRYIGLRRLEVEGEEGDYLFIEYAGGDRLYLPLHKLSLLQRYKAQEGASPPLDRLGGATWERTKKRVRKAAERVAKELLRVYAERKAFRGYAFTGRDRLFDEFAASFEYEETPDQRRAIEEVLRDMESPRPMDRLVCGDVGYGKTEVALRASFKAVLHGKQVAFLVPTTILAQQHYETFRYRFAPYPVNVELLSRFRNRKEQKDVLERLARGEVDIVIGTHRLLQKDVVFKDLGLVIIDEEHRFGVKDKERLKEMKRLVDVLTLTATPIPRTLQMCLSGIRDVSIINTPPENRLAVKTYITRFNEEVIREAVLREMERGGQVFFIHNRVKTIYRMAEFLKALLPKIRIGVAHGQMREDDLERIMWDFYHRRYDLLVTTSIVESGLDIPTVNTIIIDRADTFGLAQLYQLRGRVGRSHHRAYAYLLIPDDEALTEEGRKRLKCIEELSDLGSGLALATWDLEIRGAGEILGTAQSGHIERVGLDMYLRLLEEAVAELKGEERVEEVEPEMRVSLPCYLPKGYVPSDKERLSFYMRLASSLTLEEIESIKEELRDRYGEIPPQGMNLIGMMELKALGKRLGIKEIALNRKKLTLSFSEPSKVSPKGMVSFLTRNRDRAIFTPDQRLVVSLRGDTLREAKGVLQWFSGSLES